MHGHVLLDEWIAPSLFLGVSIVIRRESLFNFAMKFLLANIIDPDGTPRSAVSDLGLYFLPVTHK